MMDMILLCVVPATMMIAVVLDTIILFDWLRRFFISLVSG
jgi:hypothetical protein